MKISEERILKRTDEVLELAQSIFIKKAENHKYVDQRNLEKSIFATLSLLKITYGEQSDQVNALLKARENFHINSSSFANSFANDIENLINGILFNLKSDIEYGFLQSLQNQVEGEILGDFTSLAKSLIDNEQKEAAAILACGALEDCMKRFGLKNGLEVYDQDLSAVVNALKGAGLIKGTQAGIIQSYVKLRNKAFHAQFDKIEIPEVVSLISFVEMFLLQNFK